MYPDDDGILSLAAGQDVEGGVLTGAGVEIASLHSRTQLMAGQAETSRDGEHISL